MGAVVGPMRSAACGRTLAALSAVRCSLQAEEVLVLVLVLMEQGPLTKDPPSKNRAAVARLEKNKS